MWIEVMDIEMVCNKKMSEAFEYWLFLLFLILLRPSFGDRTVYYFLFTHLEVFCVDG
uniref:Uncharacterized protein n=1 Tax=Anguilla anguilla TaxID=7936 RepID=A0A0E9PZ64_ANGAN